MLLLGWAAV